MKDLTHFIPQKILVCQQRQIGDVLLATPVFTLLKQRFPHAKLHLFTEKKCEPLLRNNPDIDAFHLIDKKDSFFQQLLFYKRIAALHFDMVIDLQQLPRCRMMSLLSRADVRISFPSTPLVHWRYTHLIPPKEGYASQTKVSLLEPLGIHWNGEAPVIRLLNEEKTRAAHLLALCGYTKNQRLIAVDSTHRRASKRWPREYFAETIRILHDSDRNFRFLLLRGPGEDTDIHALQKLCIDKGIPERSLLIPEPLPDIRLSAACIAMADLLIGCCSSPRHIAAAVGTPSLVIPGASGTAWRLPSPLHQELRPALTCQPCSKTDCSDPQCLLQISPQKAAHKAKEMLAATPELHRQELL